MARDVAGAGASDVARGCSQHPDGHRSCSECDGGVGGGASPPTWGHALEAVRVVRYPPHLRRTLLTTAIVGTVLFCINQLDVVLAGDATAAVWWKGAVTYVVPFAVSNVGILIATHRRPDDR